MHPRIDVLLRAIEEAFDKKSWHGTNLKGSIRGLDLRTASWRPSEGRHNIWEIVVHCAYWKYAVRRRLTGEKRGSFPLEGSNWYERPVQGENRNKLWKSDVALLTAEHRQLRGAVAALDPRRLEQMSGKTRISSLLTGVAAHDVYHAGQIQLLKRLHAST